MKSSKSSGARPPKAAGAPKKGPSPKVVAGLARRTEGDEEHAQALEESALRIEEIGRELRDRNVMRSREVVARLDRSGAPLKHRIRALENGAGRRQLLRALRRERDGEIERILDSGALTWKTTLRKRSGTPLGAGFDERVVEIPLAIECAAPETTKRILDAGATLNLSRFRGHLSGDAAFVHFTQSGEAEDPEFDGPRFSYLFGDLRELPFRDEWFDRVLCISTLEHVGMDNQRYGGPAEEEPETWRQAVAELKRVLSRGGTLMISVPCGRPRSLGWYRVFGREDVEDVEEALAPLEVETRYFAYDREWFDSKPKQMAELDVEESVIRGLAVLRAQKAA